MEATMALRAKSYFDERATREMRQNLKPKERTVQERLAYACRILAMNGQEAGLAGWQRFQLADAGVLLDAAFRSGIR